MRPTFIVIPALNPSLELIELVKKLDTLADLEIIVVNDGSELASKEIFETIKKLDKVQILEHTINLGKGAALKTAFKFILSNRNSLNSIIVTADADGQHSFSDIKRIRDFADIFKEKFLVLGIRNFSKNTPLRSKLGNCFINWALKTFHGIDCNGDSQTGLRAFSGDLIKNFSHLEGDRYEYETNMLLCSKNGKLSLKFLPIETIYIDKNNSSYFRPFIDSYIVLKQLFNYSIVGFISFVIEVFTFYILSIFFGIIQANFLSRALSLIANFSLLRKRVFQTKQKIKYMAFKYVFLAIFNSILVGICINFSSKLFQIEYIIFLKVIFDGILFFINYFLVKKLIFKDFS